MRLRWSTWLALLLVVSAPVALWFVGWSDPASAQDDDDEPRRAIPPEFTHPDVPELGDDIPPLSDFILDEMDEEDDAGGDDIEPDDDLGAGGDDIEPDETEDLPDTGLLPPTSVALADTGFSRLGDTGPFMVPGLALPGERVLNVWVEGELVPRGTIPLIAGAPPFQEDVSVELIRLDGRRVLRSVEMLGE